MGHVGASGWSGYDALSSSIAYDIIPLESMWTCYHVGPGKLDFAVSRIQSHLAVSLLLIKVLRTVLKIPHEFFQTQSSQFLKFFQSKQLQFRCNHMRDN
jgi:hypothetical protein